MCKGNVHDGQADNGGIIELERGLLVIPEHLQFQVDKTDAMASISDSCAPALRINGEGATWTGLS